MFLSVPDSLTVDRPITTTHPICQQETGADCVYPHFRTLSRSETFHQLKAWPASASVDDDGLRLAHPRPWRQSRPSRFLADRCRRLTRSAEKRPLLDWH